MKKIEFRHELSSEAMNIYHAGRFNEKKSETKSKKIINWDDREVFFTNTDTVEA